MFSIPTSQPSRKINENSRFRRGTGTAPPCCTAPVAAAASWWCRSCWSGSCRWTPPTPRAGRDLGRKFWERRCLAYFFRFQRCVLEMFGPFFLIFCFLKVCWMLFIVMNEVFCGKEDWYFWMIQRVSAWEWCFVSPGVIIWKCSSFRDWGLVQICNNISWNKSQTIGWCIELTYIDLTRKTTEKPRFLDVNYHIIYVDDMIVKAKLEVFGSAFWKAPSCGGDDGTCLGAWTIRVLLNHGAKWHDFNIWSKFCRNVTDVTESCRNYVTMLLMNIHKSWWFCNKHQLLK